MTFELETPTKVKITEVDVLSDKDRAPDTNPGAAISFHMTVGNDTLSLFDPFLRGMLYTKVATKQEPQQQGLEGVPKVNGVDITSDMPKLTTIGMKLGEFTWDLDLSGYRLLIDYGLGGPKSDMEIADCVLSRFRFSPKEGGSVVVKFRVEAPDVSEQLHGKLALLKTQEALITLTAPVVEEEEDKQRPLTNPFPVEGGAEPAVNPFTPEDALAAAHAEG